MSASLLLPRTTSPVLRLFAMLIGVALLLTAGFACALDALVVQVRGVSGAGWHTGPISVELDLAEADVLSFTASAAAVRLPAPLHEARKAKVRCPRAQRVAGRWQCTDATVQIEFNDRETLLFQASLALSPDDGALSLSAKDQPFAGGAISVELRSQHGVVDVDSRFSRLNLLSLQQLATLLGVASPVTASAGQVSGTIRVNDNKGARVAAVNLQLEAGAFSDERGSNAGEGVQLRVQLNAHMMPVNGGGRGVWEFESNTVLDAGVVYMDPLLFEVGARENSSTDAAAVLARGGPVSVRLRGERSADGRVQITELALRDTGVLQVDASMQLATLPQLQLLRVSVDVPEQPVAALYARYVKPFAGTGMGADLRLQGAVSAHLDWSRSDSGEVDIVSSVHIKQMDVGDSAGQFSILGLQGELFWRSGARGRPLADGADGADATQIRNAASPVTSLLTSSPSSLPSTVQWRSIQLRALELGAGALNLRLVGRDVDLLAPLQVDLLDGAVQVERLQGRSMGTAQQHLEMQLSVLPISLQRLSDRLAWLPLSGSIAGRIPKLVLSADLLRVDGDVHMDLFDGKARISNVQVMNPFSAVSRLHADLFVTDIDLGVLSRAFSFGQIEGRLGGEVRDLILESWQPVAFDAALSTPADDTSRHRISQRAVDNLASLGGAQAVLSSTFLRFFEEFSYARLGLRCRLLRGVCEMGGVAPAAQGYYIVEGGGMPPRVDVVGFNRRVDWHTLLERLKAVTSSSGPVIR